MANATMAFSSELMEDSRPQIEELFIPLTRRLKIYSCIHPTDNAQGVVLLTHGLGEHSGRYGHVIHRLQAAGLSVVRFDLPGHGRSDGKRGHVEGYESLIDVVSLLFNFTQQRFPGLPIVPFGHSLGGNIVANWLLRRRELAAEVAGAVLSSPWFLLTKAPSTLKVALFKTIARIVPQLPVPAQFRPKKLTRNEAAIDCYEHDPLIHRRASIQLISEAYSAGIWALEHAAECQTPILGTHGTADTVTDPAGTRLFCERAPHAELLLYENLVHEPHNEPEWRTVVQHLANWIAEHVEAKRDRSSMDSQQEFCGDASGRR